MIEIDYIQEAKYVSQTFNIVLNKNDSNFYKYETKEGIYKIMLEQPLKCIITEEFVKEYGTLEWRNHYTDNIYKTLPYCARKVKLFSERKDIIVFKNGVLNIEDKSFSKFSKNYKVTTRVPFDYHKYDEQVKTPVFDKYLDDIAVGDETMKKTLMEFIGYCLCGHIYAGKCFILYGNGSNGKSVFCNLLDHIVRSSTNLNMHNINKSRFSLHSMIGSKVNIVNELPNSISLNEIFDANMKSIITGEPVSVEAKGKDVYFHTFSTKMLIATNIFPAVKKMPDYSVKRRFLILPFLATFSGENVDPHLLDNLKKETEGIISKAMNAYFAFQNRGYKFSYEKSSDVLFDKAVYEEFPIIMFVKEKVRYSNGNRVSYKKLHYTYEAWCVTKGLSKPQLSGKHFANLFMQALQFNMITHSKIYKSNGIRGIENIMLI